MRALLFSLLLGAAVMLTTACGTAPGIRPRAEIPSRLLGHFTDDYGEERTLTPEFWHPARGEPSSIDRWNPAEEWLLLRDSETGRWTRVDWVLLDDPDWSWAFCLTAWDQPSADAALREGEGVADRANPRTGCNGSPFTRMGTTAPRDA